MATRTTSELLLVDDLEDRGGDPDALRSVADWIRAFVARPNGHLGRAGPICPFVPGALERRTLWLASEEVAGQDVTAVVQLMTRYRRLFLETAPTDGDDAIYKVIVVVFADLPADRAGVLFDEVLDELAAPSYVDDGVVFGPFYAGNEGTAIYNSSFRPFQSPVPFLFVRHGVVGDWKFFLDDDAQLERWANRYGASGALALAEEVRGLPWRSPPHSEGRFS
jgi:hypothetical protein